MKKIATKAQKPNPALKALEFLIGHWQTTGTHPFFPDTTLHGRASGEWLEAGAFLLLRSEIDHPEFPDGIQIFGSDDQAKTYFMLHFDERGISRKYDVSVKENDMQWWRDEPHFSQRFTLVKKGDKLVSSGEMSRNGGPWEKDLSMTFKLSHS